MDRLENFLKPLADAAGKVTAGGIPPNMLVALPLSILFGFALYRLYLLYYQDNEPQDGSLARSLIALTPAMTVTFLIIQSSLTLSLGLLGSLSFVRFRTSIKRSEDVSFVIIAISIAIACAVGQYGAGLMLLGMLAFYSIVRNRTGHTEKDRRFAVITYNTRKALAPASITKELDALGIAPEFVSSRAYDGITSYVFNARKVTDQSHPRITAKLADLDSAAHINVFFPNERLGA